MNRPYRILLVNDEDVTADSSHRPTAIIFKPYKFAEFLGAVQNVLSGAVLLIGLPFCLAPTSSGQAEPTLESSARPNAVTLSVHGKCDCSDDGITFRDFERGHIFEKGALLRTGQKSWADIFFRRTGTTVRLQENTEIRIEKMSVTVKNGLPVVDTLLDLRAGRVFTVVRSAIAGNTFEIQNASGRSVVEGSGIGRYIITADGTHVSAIGSVIPLKVMGENGITILAAGEQFTRKDGKMFAALSTPYVNDLIQLDELQALTETVGAKN